MLIAIHENHKPNPLDRLVQPNYRPRSSQTHRGSLSQQFLDTLEAFSKSSEGLSSLINCVTPNKSVIQEAAAEEREGASVSGHNTPSGNSTSIHGTSPKVAL